MSDDLADMVVISKYNKKNSFSLCVIEIISKYLCAIPLKDKTYITITNAFPNFLDQSGSKSNKIWVDKCSEFTINQ